MAKQETTKAGPNRGPKSGSVSGPVLVLDASSSTSLVALVQDCSVNIRQATAKMGQAGLLTESLVEVLQEANVQAHDIKTIIAGVGPGSFTGIRICLATALGLKSGVLSSVPKLDDSKVNGPELRGIDSFDVQHAAFRRLHPELATKTVLVLVESKRPDLFAQVYSPEGKKFGEAFLIQVDDLKNQRVDVISGDGLPSIDALIDMDLELVSANIEVEAADYLAADEANKKSGKYVEPQPFYLRPPDIGVKKPNMKSQYLHVAKH